MVNSFFSGLMQLSFGIDVKNLDVHSKTCPFYYCLTLTGRASISIGS